MPSAKSNNLTGFLIYINLIFFPLSFCSFSALRKILKLDMDSGHPCWVLYFSEMASWFFFHLERFRLWVLGFTCLQFSNLAYWKKNCFSVVFFLLYHSSLSFLKNILHLKCLFSIFKVFLHFFYLKQVIYCSCTLFSFPEKILNVLHLLFSIVSEVFLSLLVTSTSDTSLFYSPS